MELRQLRYFLAVAEYLHFTAAAEHLGIAQPPLSQQIQKLEREIGTRLFVRHPRRLELTEAGLRLRQRARQIIDDTQRALDEAKRAGRGDSGRLRIGFAGSTVFHPRTAALMRAFREAHPEVEIGCEESNSTVLIEQVREQRVDAALVRLPLHCEELKTDVLAEETMLAVLPHGHGAAKRTRLKLIDLKDDGLVIFPRPIGPQLHDAILGACRTAGFEPRIALESPQISSAPNMVAAGFGVAVIPASVRQGDAEGVSYHALVDAPKTAIGLIYRPRDKSALVANLRALARKLA